MVKSQHKLVLLGIRSSVVVVLLAALILPTIAVSAANFPRDPLRTPAFQNNANVQGTISALSDNSVTITAMNSGNPVTLILDTHTSLLLYGVTSLATGQTISAIYDSKTMVAERVMVNTSMPPSGPTIIPSNQNITNMKGTISAVPDNSVAITPSAGNAAVSLILDSHTIIVLYGVDSLATGQTVDAVYNSQTMVADRIMVNVTLPSPGILTPANKNFANVEGTISIVSDNSTTITPLNGGTTVTLTFDSHTDIILYGVSSLATGQTVDSVYNTQTMVADRIMVNIPTQAPNIARNLQNHNTENYSNNAQRSWFGDRFRGVFNWLGHFFHRD
jgi:hypothetical protein